MGLRRRRSVLAAIGSVALAGCTQTSSQDTDGGSGRSGHQIGTRQNIGDIAAEISDLQVASQFTTDEEHHASGGVVFLLAKVRVTNVGDSPTTLPSGHSFVVVSGSEQFGPSDVTERFREPVTGEPYSRQLDALPDVSSEGWLVFELPQDLEDGVIGWSHQTTWDPDSDEVRYWDLSVDLEDAANIRIVDVSVPDRAERYTSTTITITVENTGQREGEFTRTVQAPPDGLDPVEFTISVPVPPGDEKEIDLEIPYQGGSSAEFSLSDSSYSFNYRDAVYEFGEAFEIENEVSITLRNFQTTPFVRTDMWGNPENQYPGEGNRYVLIHVDAQIQEGFRGSIGERKFNIVSPTSIRPETNLGSLVEPISGSMLPDVPTSEPGEVSGHIAFVIPQSIDENEIEIEYNHNPGGGSSISAQWQHP